MQHSCYNPPFAGTCDDAQLRRLYSNENPLTMSGLKMHGIKRLLQKIAALTSDLLPPGFCDVRRFLTAVRTG